MQSNKTDVRISSISSEEDNDSNTSQLDLNESCQNDPNENEFFLIGSYAKTPKKGIKIPRSTFVSMDVYCISRYSSNSIPNNFYIRKYIRFENNINKIIEDWKQQSLIKSLVELYVKKFNAIRTLDVYKKGPVQYYDVCEELENMFKEIIKSEAPEEAAANYMTCFEKYYSITKIFFDSDTKDEYQSLMKDIAGIHDLLFENMVSALNTKFEISNGLFVGECIGYNLYPMYSVTEDECIFIPLKNRKPLKYTHTNINISDNVTSVFDMEPVEIKQGINSDSKICDKSVYKIAGNVFVSRLIDGYYLLIKLSYCNDELIYPNRRLAKKAIDKLIKTGSIKDDLGIRKLIDNIKVDHSGKEKSLISINKGVLMYKNAPKSTAKLDNLLTKKSNKSSSKYLKSVTSNFKVAMICLAKKDTTTAKASLKEQIKKCLESSGIMSGSDVFNFTDTIEPSRFSFKKEKSPLVHSLLKNNQVLQSEEICKVVDESDSTIYHRLSE